MDALWRVPPFAIVAQYSASCSGVIGYPVEEELQKAEEQVRAQIQSWR